MKREDYLLDGERLDDLECNGMFVLQKAGGYCFTSDSVSLANFVKASAKERAAELGAGCGVISILVTAKTAVKEITAFEIQPRLADSAKRNVEMNGLSDRVKVVCADIKKLAKDLGGTFDLVFFNPPYYTKKGSADSERDIARTEIAATLEDFIKIAADLVKFGGRVYSVGKTERMAETFYLMKKYGIEPKVLRLLIPKPDGIPDAFLVEGKRGGNVGLKFAPCAR